MRVLAVLLSLLPAAALLAGCVAEGEPTARDRSAGIHRGCPQINVGTPGNPKFIPDPGCDSPAD